MENLNQDLYLLEGLARQESLIIELIYKNNYQSIQSLIFKNNGSADDAADIFQEAMIILYQKSIDKDFILTCQLKTYLYSVCKRLWLKKLKNNNRLAWQDESFDNVIAVETDIEEHIENQRHFSIMENAMQKIGEPCKSLLEAYYIHKKQMLEIAEDFKYTNADNAKTQKYKCMMRLKKIFFSEFKNRI